MIYLIQILTLWGQPFSTHFFKHVDIITKVADGLQRQAMQVNIRHDIDRQYLRETKGFR